MGLRSGGRLNRSKHVACEARWILILTSALVPCRRQGDTLKIFYIFKH